MTQKTHLFNQSSREAAKIAQKANLFKGQQQKKIVCAYFKGKRVMKPLKNTMQMDVDLAMEIHLADKIIVDILMRLPVRSLLRFKCVSKFWRTLISDPYFKMKHLIHARNNQNSQKLLISQFYLGMDHSFSFYCSSLLVKDVQKLDCPLNIEQVILRIFCCYDGLSIVGVGDCSSEEFKFFLWNPSTRESIELPVPELLPRKGYCTWGMGYDSTSDDYKILKIDKEVHSEILALKSGSWETIYRHPPGISFVAWGTESLSFLHGAFHWLGKSLNYSVVSFSISNKVYGEIPLPDQMFLICDADEIEYGVSVLRGMLCCYSTSYILGKDGTFKLWVLKDYDVKESWYQMAIITCTGLSQCRPKYWIAEHEFLLFSRYGVDSGFVFGTSNEPFGLQPRIEAFREGFVYTESLIFPRLST